jgi:hypothetical protein
MIAIVGRWLTAGGGEGLTAGRTTAVVPELADADPARFVAVTATRSVCVTSAERTP